MSAPVPTSALGAVFLSYAREDTDAARRIADALRGFGVEVWFDQSELRGGDAWDQKIRRQIKECVLFLPLISQRTQDRGEGYFRLEWKLAVERTHQMAEGMPFLAPVAIDDAHEADALVPPEFMRVHWTRLQDGMPTPQFVEQIKRLLEAPRKSTATRKAESAGPQFPSPAAAPPLSATPAATKSGLPLWVTAALAVAVLGLGAYVVMRPAAREPAGASKPIANNPSPAAAAAADKSIAVLPFANMSDDKDSAFFTDGIHEDILTNLSNIRELKVTSRTTVVQYRDSKKTLRQIGEELGVAYILEGSVRRAGQTVRVTGQLINARTDEHVWAKAYDRDLTDIFAIQSELAQAIATALQAAISPQEKTLLDQRPTNNLAAYELVLKAREFFRRPFISDRDEEEHQRLLQKAVQLDPNYAIAYADLAYSYAFGYFLANPRTADLTKAKEAIDSATRLAPGSPEVIRALGDYYYYGYLDFPRALEQYEKVAQLRPNDPVYYARVAAIRRRQARWLESLAAFRKLTEIDPGDLRNRRDTAVLLAAGRRYDEAIEALRGAVERAPDELRAGFDLAELPFVARGSTREMAQFLARLSPAQLDSAQGVTERKLSALHHGDLAEALRLDRLQAPDNATAIEMAMALMAQGDAAAARARLGNLPAELRAQTDSGLANSYAWRELGLAEALLGHKEEALRCARKAMELTPESRDAVAGVNHRFVLALVYTWTGDKDAAIAELAYLFRTPFGISGNAGAPPNASVHTMRLDPRFAPLRGDPRFEALLADPKNNAPLF